MRLFTAAAPGHTAVIIVLDLLMATLEPLSVWFMKFLVDAVVANQVRMAVLVALLLVIYRMISNLAMWAYEVVTPGQIDRLQFALQTRLMEKAVSIQDLTLFESPKFYDQLQTARQATATWAQRLFMTAKQLLACFVVVAFLFGTLSLLHPLAAIIMFLATIPSYLAHLRLGVESTTVFSLASSLPTQVGLLRAGAHHAGRCEGSSPIWAWRVSSLIHTGMYSGNRTSWYKVSAAVRPEL